MGAAYLERRYLSSGRSRREMPQQIVVRVPHINGPGTQEAGCVAVIRATKG